MKISEIVKDRPCKENYGDPVVCPQCGGTPKYQGGEETSLGDIAGGDINHKTDIYICGCGLEFTRHSRRFNIWYARKGTGELLRGVPSCFENFLYHCQRCDGLVERNYRSSSGHRNDMPVFVCQKCGHGGDTEIEYFDPRQPDGF